ncbi:hypothetical protein PT974_05190 [Cladobotryum mycophilum]|uniref:Uncharacterized protein n=1 Tax=Cladobotryum mycophilum TaxID=491253 RepID=A0ABR0S4F8_9HYPO
METLHPTPSAPKARKLNPTSKARNTNPRSAASRPKKPTPNAETSGMNITSSGSHNPETAASTSNEPAPNVYPSIITVSNYCKPSPKPKSSTTNSLTLDVPTTATTVPKSRSPSPIRTPNNPNLKVLPSVISTLRDLSPNSNSGSRTPNAGSQKRRAADLEIDHNEMERDAERGEGCVTDISTVDSEPHSKRRKQGLPDDDLSGGRSSRKPSDDGSSTLRASGIQNED